MSQVYVCMQYEGVKHLGGLHYGYLDFSIKIPDRSKNATGIVRSKSRRGLIPLTEHNLEKMAEYLISELKVPFYYKPHIFINFDSREILVNERRTSEIDLREEAGKLFKYCAVTQKVLDKNILCLNEKDSDLVIELVKNKRK